MEREQLLHEFIEQQVCVSDMNFFDMVKTIRTAEVHSNIKIDPRTVTRILDKMDRDGRILIDRRTIFMDNDDDEENAKCEATFYMSVDCTQGNFDLLFEVYIQGCAANPDDENCQKTVRIS